MTSLHKDPEALAALREKLFILWGDLEERKTRERALMGTDVNQQTNQSIENERLKQQSETAARAPAFHCCVKEYGILQRIMDQEDASTCDEEEDREETYTWDRTFRMFGTTIK